MNQTETHYKVLRHLEANPEITQRELAQELGVSVGKVNYCIKALVQKGWVKANNFKNNKNKSAYVYLLTPKGIENKAQITVRYLRRRFVETRPCSGDLWVFGYGSLIYLVDFPSLESRPASIRKLVDLPQPEGPTKTRNSLSST
mgnify:CR=1 FL=1